MLKKHSSVTVRFGSPWAESSYRRVRHDDVRHDNARHEAPRRHAPRCHQDDYCAGARSCNLWCVLRVKNSRLPDELHRAKSSTTAGELDAI